MTDLEWTLPYLPFVGSVLGVLLVGGFNVYNRKRGAVEGKAPSVAELWKQQEVDRQARFTAERALEKLRKAFRHYIDRVKRGGSTELTATEQSALDYEPKPE